MSLRWAFFKPQEQVSTYTSALGKITSYNSRSYGGSSNGVLITYPDLTSTQVTYDQSSKSIDSRAIQPPSWLLSKGPDSPSNDKAGGYSPAKPVITMRISG